jgi:hypothetical protein
MRSPSFTADRGYLTENHGVGGSIPQAPIFWNFNNKSSFIQAGLRTGPTLGPTPRLNLPRIGCAAAAAGDGSAGGIAGVASGAGADGKGGYEASAPALDARIGRIGSAALISVSSPQRG